MYEVALEFLRKHKLELPKPPADALWRVQKEIELFDVTKLKKEDSSQKNRSFADIVEARQHLAAPMNNFQVQTKFH